MSKKDLKKILSVALILVMPFSVFTTTNAYESSELTGEGVVIYAEVDDIVKVIVPTSSKLDFTLDPLGLYTLEEGGAGKSMDELKASPQAGSVDFYGNTPVVINASSFDLLVKLDMMVTGDAALVPTAASARRMDDDKPYLFINMKASRDAVLDPAADASTFVGTVERVLEAINRQVLFMLEKAVYTVSLVEDEYIFELTTIKSGTQLLFGGACNPYGNWIEFVDTDVPATNKVGINAVFTFEKATGTYLTDPNAHGLVTTWLPPDEPDGVGFRFGENGLVEYPEGPNYGYLLATQRAHMTVHAGPGVFIPFNFGNYEPASDILPNHHNDAYFTTFTFDETGFTADFSRWMPGGPEAFTLWIKITNDKYYALWVTVVEPIPP